MPECKKVLKKHINTIVTCQRDTGVNRRRYQWPKLEQFVQFKEKGRIVYKGKNLTNTASARTLK